MTLTQLRDEMMEYAREHKMVVRDITNLADMQIADMGCGREYTHISGEELYLVLTLNEYQGLGKSAWQLSISPKDHEKGPPVSEGTVNELLQVFFGNASILALPPIPIHPTQRQFAALI